MSVKLAAQLLSRIFRGGLYEVTFRRRCSDANIGLVMSAKLSYTFDKHYAHTTANKLALIEQSLMPFLSYI